MTGALAASSSTSSINPTAVLITVGIPFVVCASIAVIVWAYFRLQAHRADAVAMAEYRKLAEQAVANQQELRSEIARLTVKVETVEKLMREVG